MNGKEADSFRIIVYGDSFIQASYSKLENTFCEKLEKTLNKLLGINVEVINAGVNGYAPDQISIRIQEEINWVRPNLVVLSIFADNDFGDLLRHKLYRFTPEGVLTLNPYHLSKNFLNKYKKEQKDLQRVMLYRLFSRLMDAKWLKAKIEFWKKRLSKKEEPLKRPSSEIEKWLLKSKEEYRNYLKEPKIVKNFMNGEYDADISIEPKSPSALLKIELMDKIIKLINDYLQKKNIPLITLIIPSPIDACENYDWQVDKKSYPNYSRKTLTSILENSVRQYGDKYLNLFDNFNNKNCNDFYFHYGNRHWNDLGQEKTALLMSQKIYNTLSPIK
ncbi:MAG: SGNH/GDSL hydrolase family protein [Nitrospinales bacterium]